jgi:hypothetical protein
MILCLTVGGVYATWTFTATENADIIDADQEVIVALNPDVDTTANLGKYTITLENLTNGNILIDQASDEAVAEGTKKQHQAVLWINPDAKITITYTPDKTAELDYKQGKFETKFSLSSPDWKAKFEASGHYNMTDGTEKPIFNLDTTERVLKNGDGNDEWTVNANGTLTYVIDATMLAEIIQLNDPIVLDSLADYNGFKSAINGTITLHVTDGVTAGQEQVE